MSRKTAEDPLLNKTAQDYELSNRLAAIFRKHATVLLSKATTS